MNEKTAINENNREVLRNALKSIDVTGMTANQVMALHGAMDAVFEAATWVDHNRTHRDYRKAFEAVSDPKNWKAPIVADVAPEVADLTASAIVFFQAGDVTLTKLGNGKVRVRSRGYQAW